MYLYFAYDMQNRCLKVIETAVKMFRDKTYILASCSDAFKHFISSNATERSIDIDDLLFETKSDLCSRGEVGKLMLGEITSEFIRTANKTGSWCI